MSKEPCGCSTRHLLISGERDLLICGARDLLILACLHSEGHAQARGGREDRRRRRRRRICALGRTVGARVKFVEVMVVVGDVGIVGLVGL